MKTKILEFSVQITNDPYNHVLSKQSAGRTTVHSPNSQGQDFSWQTKGVCTDGRFGGGGEWRWISEVIRDDILRRLQQRPSPFQQKTTCFWGKLLEDPVDLMHRTHWCFFYKTDAWWLADTRTSHTERNKTVFDLLGSG